MKHLDCGGIGILASHTGACPERVRDAAAVKETAVVLLAFQVAEVGQPDAI